MGGTCANVRGARPAAETSAATRPSTTATGISADRDAAAASVSGTTR
jgi:hypothetical protein